MDMVGSCSSLTIELKCHWAAAAEPQTSVQTSPRTALGHGRTWRGDRPAFTRHRYLLEIGQNQLGENKQNTKKKAKLWPKSAQRYAYSLSSVHLVEENNRTVQGRIPIYSHIS